MPKVWLYYIALLLPLALRLAVLGPFLTNWLWYSGHEQAFYAIQSIVNSAQFDQFIGNWAYPAFAGAVVCRWMTDEDGDSIPLQFLLLPLFYVPFTIIGDTLAHAEFHLTSLYTFPLVIIPFGYIYIFTWMTFIWAAEKTGLVM